jgi:predicted metal-binding membrane protein
MSFKRAGSPSGFPPLATGLAVLSWIALLIWEASPYGRYLNHGSWGAGSIGAIICSAVPGGSWLIPSLIYGGGWLLMSAAMMLPTALPLIRLFDRMVAEHSDRAHLHGLLIAGYLVAWGMFGVAAHILDQALHRGLSGWIWLTVHHWVPGAILLALAGLFQFSGLKYHCLDKCRTPLSFITAHWHGPRPRHEAFALGAMHGLYCIGCCWALMLLMFVVGTGSIGWMLVLGLIMAIEKNHRWGRYLSAPVGGALLAMAGLVVINGLL